MAGMKQRNRIKDKEHRQKAQKPGAGVEVAAPPPSPPPMSPIVEEVIARFGEATVLRRDGRVVLRGGSMADRMEALEWLSMFMPETAPALEQ